MITDLSTSNAVAFYELGVRHALRPYATILIREKDGRSNFDLNQVVTMECQHLGADIGARGARDKKRELHEKIAAVIQAQETDSPVVSFIPDLARAQIAEAVVPPRLTSCRATPLCGSNSPYTPIN